VIPGFALSITMGIFSVFMLQPIASLSKA